MKKEPNQKQADPVMKRLARLLSKKELAAASGGDCTIPPHRTDADTGPQRPRDY